MRHRLLALAVVLLSVSTLAPLSAQETDAMRDILVTFDNHGARNLGTGTSAPYRNRKRYSIAAAARRNADDIRAEYTLVEVDHWPIRSLSVYCFVYRIPRGENREAIIKRLEADGRIDSVQPLQEFAASMNPAVDYDDTYANLQHGLSVLNIRAAHRYSKGQGIRIAIIDSNVDSQHEDLQGRLRKVELFTTNAAQVHAEHGTAVASVIGANANNAKGIVGIAPQARLDLFVACWADDKSGTEICDSFTLAKALDSLLEDPADILNMSITGPFDPLLARLLLAVQHAGVIVIAARRDNVDISNHFPASLQSVISVGNGDQRPLVSRATMQPAQDLYAPGDEIMVALPNNAYDFRSGSSLAAAHVSGVVALLLAVSPHLTYESVQKLLQESQTLQANDVLSIDACGVLHLADKSRLCQ